MIPIATRTTFNFQTRLQFQNKTTSVCEDREYKLLSNTVALKLAKIS